MISYIKGTVAFKGNDYIVIENHGIGYQIKVPSRVLDSMESGENVMLHTYLYVREDVLALFGFSSEHAPYLLLSTSLPQTDELDNALEGASFQLVRRSGFMASYRVETPLKKKTQYALSAGSVLQNRYQGALYDVGLSDVHPVYRYSKPIFMGVTL